MNSATIAVAMICGLTLAGAFGAASAESELAEANIVDAEGASVGTIAFKEGPHGVLINVQLKGLPPGPKGMHIHGVGTCEDHAAGFKASKDHVGKGEGEHGLMNPKGPEDGDLPNIHVHSDGTAIAELFSSRISLVESEDRSALLDDDGSAIVIHAQPDDHMTPPIGGAGDRIACGVIEAAS